MGQLTDAELVDLSGNDKNKITGKKYQPVMSITGLNDQGHNYIYNSNNLMFCSNHTFANHFLFLVKITV